MLNKLASILIKRDVKFNKSQNAFLDLEGKAETFGV